METISSLEGGGYILLCPAVNPTFKIRLLSECLGSSVGQGSALSLQWIPGPGTGTCRRHSQKKKFFFFLPPLEVVVLVPLLVFGFQPTTASPGTDRLSYWIAGPTLKRREAEKTAR